MSFLLSLKEQDDWEDYFNDYKKNLQNLENEILEINNKINQEVYKLYNLTKKEIQIIEGEMNAAEREK